MSATGSAPSGLRDIDAARRIGWRASWRASWRTSRAFSTLVVLTALASSGCATSSTGRITPEQAARADAEARHAIANERAISAAELPQRTVAVAPFRVSSSDTLIAPLGYGLADLLMTDLARSSQIRLVDRLQLDAIMRELDLAQSGKVDTTTAPRVGRLVGARRMVLGSLASGGDGALVIDARIADVATSELRDAVSATAPLDRIFDAEKELAFRLLRELGVQLTPAERAAVEQRPTANISAFLAYSRGVRFEALGDYGAATQEFRRALTIDPSFQMAGARLGGTSTASAVQQTRAASMVTQRVNGTFTSPVGGSNLGGAVDPAYPGSDAVTGTLIITVTAPAGSAP
jgi:TolB-like protein